VTLPIVKPPQWMRDPLGAWCLRATCRLSGNADKLAASARWLLEQLHATGVTTLEELKQQVDKVARDHTPDEDASRSMNRDANKEMYGRGIVRLLKSWGVMKKHGHKSKHTSQAARYVGERCLLRAVYNLHLASSIDEITPQLMTETCDEIMLRSLAEQLASQGPALAQLRAASINCDFDVDQADSDAASASDLSSDTGWIPHAEEPSSDASSAGCNSVVKQSDTNNVTDADQVLKPQEGLSNLFDSPFSAMQCFAGLKRCETGSGGQTKCETSGPSISEILESAASSAALFGSAAENSGKVSGSIVSSTPPTLEDDLASSLTATLPSKVTELFPLSTLSGSHCATDALQPTSIIDGGHSLMKPDSSVNILGRSGGITGEWLWAAASMSLPNAPVTRQSSSSHALTDLRSGRGRVRSGRGQGGRGMQSCAKPTPKGSVKTTIHKRGAQYHGW